MKPSISTQTTPTNIQAVLALLEVSPHEFERFGLLLPDAEHTSPLGEGQRSLVQDLAHVINSDEISSQAIYLALLLDEPLLHDIHSERDWGQLLRRDLFPFSDLIAYFKLRRAVLLRVLQSLNEAQWHRTIREEGKQRRESVYWRARVIALHEADHIADLERRIELR